MKRLLSWAAAAFFAAAPAFAAPPSPPPYSVLQGYATLSVSNVSSRVAFPSGASGAIVVYNSGTTDAFFRQGTTSCTAVTSDVKIKAGMSLTLYVSNVDICAITAASTTTLDVWQANGPLYFAGGGGSSGGGCSSPCAVTESDGAFVNLGALADAAWGGSGNGTLTAITKAIEIQDAAVAAAAGTTADAAWSGSGAGTEIAILKKVVSQLAGSLAVTGTFWQATQPVSAASLPLPSNAAQETGGNLATVAGAVSGGKMQDNLAQVGGSAITLGIKLSASSIPVVLASDEAALAVTQSGTWNVGITGTAAVTQSGSWTVSISGTPAITCAACALESGGNLATLAGGVTASVYQENVKQVNGVTTQTGVGAGGTGTQRVAAASDSFNGNEFNATVIPTVQNASYAAGQALGGLQTISVGSTNGLSGILDLFRVESKGGSTVTLVVYIWQKNPASTTCTDKTNFVVNQTDNQQLIVPPFLITPALGVSAQDAHTYASISFNGNFVNGSSNTNLYVCVLANAAVTPASTTDLTYNISGTKDAP